MPTPSARSGGPVAPTDQLADHLAAVEGLHALLPALRTVGDRLIDVYRRGGRLYTFGNGGSAADAQHLAGELIGRYLRERRPLPAVSLVTDPTVVSCIGNDYSFDEVFARQVQALATADDMVIAFSTSGRSRNVVRGLQQARDAGAVTVLFAGGTDSGMPAAEHADLSSRGAGQRHRPHPGDPPHPPAPAQRACRRLGRGRPGDRGRRHDSTPRRPTGDRRRMSTPRPRPPRPSAPPRRQRAHRPRVAVAQARGPAGDTGHLPVRRRPHGGVPRLRVHLRLRDVPGVDRTARPATVRDHHRTRRGGRWQVVGGWWIEPDCNIPSGESFVRQALYGQRYLLEKFGPARYGRQQPRPLRAQRHAAPTAAQSRAWTVTCSCAPAPTSRCCRVSSSTGSPRTAPASRLPPAQRVLHPGAGHRGHLDKSLALLPPDEPELMVFYGVGNHGGGPTKANLDSIRRLDSLGGLPGLRLSHPEAFFARIRGRQDTPRPRRGTAAPRARLLLVALRGQDVEPPGRERVAARREVGVRRRRRHR